MASRSTLGDLLARKRHYIIYTFLAIFVGGIIFPFSRLDFLLGPANSVEAGIDRKVSYLLVMVSALGSLIASMELWQHNRPALEVHLNDDAAIDRLVEILHHDIKHIDYAVFHEVCADRGKVVMQAAARQSRKGSHMEVFISNDNQFMTSDTYEYSVTSERDIRKYCNQHACQLSFFRYNVPATLIIRNLNNRVINIGLYSYHSTQHSLDALTKSAPHEVRMLFGVIERHREYCKQHRSSTIIGHLNPSFILWSNHHAFSDILKWSEAISFERRQSVAQIGDDGV